MNEEFVPISVLVPWLAGEEEKGCCIELDLILPPSVHVVLILPPSVHVVV